MLVVVNTSSGMMSRADERDRLRALLDRATFVEVTDGSRVAEVVDQNEADVVVAAGGDGTISAAAGCIAGTDRALGVIPGGTLNHFAKDLGIPSDLVRAASIIRAGNTRRVDVAEVNGRTFLNNSSLGLYVEIVREREKFRQHGWRKWTAFAVAVIQTLAHWPIVKARVEIEGRVVDRRTPFLFIGNNRYRMEGLRMGSRARLNEGQLCLLAARRLSRWALARMAVAGLTGGIHRSSDLDVLCAPEAWVKTKRRVAVALDGEVTRMRPPLHFRIRPRALKVLAP